MKNIIDNRTSDEIELDERMFHMSTEELQEWHAGCDLLIITIAKQDKPLSEDQNTEMRNIERCQHRLFNEISLRKETALEREKILGKIGTVINDINEDTLGYHLGTSRRIIDHFAGKQLTMDLQQMLEVIEAYKMRDICIDEVTRRKINKEKEAENV